MKEKMGRWEAKETGNDFDSHCLLLLGSCPKSSLRILIWYFMRCSQQVAEMSFNQHILSHCYLPSPVAGTPGSMIRNGSCPLEANTAQ